MTSIGAESQGSVPLTNTKCPYRYANHMVVTLWYQPYVNSKSHVIA